MNRSVNRRLLRGQLELLKLLLIDIGIGEDSTIHELIPETMGYRGDVTYDNSKLDGTLRKLMCGLDQQHRLEAAHSACRGLAFAYDEFKTTEGTASAA